MNFETRTNDLILKLYGSEFKMQNAKIKMTIKNAKRIHFYYLFFSFLFFFILIFDI
jgi:hypothetical protein